MLNKKTKQGESMKLIDNNIHRIFCEVNGCKDMGLSFNFLYYDKNDDFSFSEIYQEDDVLNVQKTIGNINFGKIASNFNKKKCLFKIDTRTSGADFTFYNE